MLPPASVRLRRSVLYVPGSNPRALEKVHELPCDGVILDLEDAVAPDQKEAARKAVFEAVTTLDFGHREVLVRVNGIDTPWGEDDFRTMASTPADGLVIPKVTSAADIRAAQNRVPNTLRLWAMIETPLAVLNVQAIAAAGAGLVGLIMGTSDLVNDLHAEHVPDRAPLLYSLSVCILAARANKLVILDGVHVNLEDDAGFAQVCLQGRQMGFDGKTLIHPKTIDKANEVFSPSPQAVAKAKRVIQAHQEAVAQGRNVAVVDGRLIEILNVQEAERVLALASQISEQT